LSVAGLAGLLWLGGAVSALLAGHRVPSFRLASLIALPRSWHDPSVAWGQPVGPTGLYWAVTLALVGALAGIVTLIDGLDARHRGRLRAWPRGRRCDTRRGSVRW